jgi:uncharacterized RDD family membrane protein YckC
MDDRDAFDLAETTLSGLGRTGSEAPATSRAATATAANAYIQPQARPRSTSGAAPAYATAELPLFVQAIPGVEADHEDEDPVPLVKVPARPRMPVSVRRATPEPARMRATYGPPVTAEPDLLDDLEAPDEAEDFAPPADLPLSPPVSRKRVSEPTPERLPAEWQQAVGGLTRLTAAMIDAAFLGAIAVVVIFFTLRLLGLPMSGVMELPLLPLAGFLLLVSVGYLLLFTAASGQTVGKMALKIRVVGTSAEAVINDRVTVSQAAIRSIAAVPSVLVFGAGFAPALVGAGLAVHDRIAQTRVVRL